VPPTFGLSGINLNFESDKIPASPLDVSLPFLIIGFEETTIIQFENNGNSDIETFRIWLGADNSFKSFKTEKGWTGEKTPQGVIIFTATDPIKPGQSVKFGVKTDKTQPGINWKAIDKNSNELQIGKTLVTESPSKPIIKNGKPTPINGIGILPDSNFKIIPKEPNVGGTIRVTGDQFSANQKFDFYIDTIFLESFETDENGHFMLTTKIPEGKVDRVDFVVKDEQKNEEIVSIRIDKDLIPRMSEVELTITGLPSTINPGDVLLISGTGSPGGTIIAEIVGPDEEKITSETAPVDQQGKWFFETIVSLATPLGIYSAEISDGNDTIFRSWTVESSKTIQIVPSKIKFEPGDTLTFNGTALPNQRINIVLENPQGLEIFSDIIQPNKSGFFEFEYPTLESSLKGTYILFATQNLQTEIVTVGLGVIPSPQIIVKTNLLNYKAGETATISISGEASTTVNLIIVDPSEQEKFKDSTLLGPDGKKDYELDLTGYASGVYTLVAKGIGTQTNEIFTVGLQIGSGKIEFSIIKDSYQPNDSILILGESGSNILITITLIDPDGNQVKIKESFTDKNGKFTESSFRVPTEAKSGIWKINIKSGPNFKDVSFEVTPELIEGMLVFFQGIEKIPGIGEVVHIKVIGAAQTVFIELYSNEGVLIIETTFLASSSGEIVQPIPIPPETPPGVYTIKVKDPFSSAETTFEYP